MNTRIEGLLYILTLASRYYSLLLSYTSFLKSSRPLLGILTRFSITKTRFDLLGLYLKEEDTN